MKSWRVIVVLVAVLLASGVFQALAQDRQREVLLDADGVEVWSDSRASDAPLRGQDVVRRDGGELPGMKAEFGRIWIVVVDCERHPSGACGFSLEYSEPADTATPKVFQMTAVDRKTCQVAFTVGIPEEPKIPDAPDMEYDLGEPEPIGEGDQKASASAVSGSGTLGYMSPEAAARLGADPLYYPLLCDQLNDPAWVYYDGVLARASTTTSRGSFQYGIVSTWQEGCGEILGWAGFRTYPGEYNNINPV